MTFHDLYSVHHSNLRLATRDWSQRTQGWLSGMRSCMEEICLIGCSRSFFYILYVLFLSGILELFAFTDTYSKQLASQAS